MFITGATMAYSSEIRPSIVRSTPELEPLIQPGPDSTFWTERLPANKHVEPDRNLLPENLTVAGDQLGPVLVRQIGRQRNL